MKSQLPKSDPSALWFWRDQNPPIEKVLLALAENAGWFIKPLQAALPHITRITQPEARMLCRRLFGNHKFRGASYVYYICHVLSQEERSRMLTVGELIHFVDRDFNKPATWEYGKTLGTKKVRLHIHAHPEFKSFYGDLCLYFGLR
jgi:hypothetical protein